MSGKFDRAHLTFNLSGYLPLEVEEGNNLIGLLKQVFLRDWLKGKPTTAVKVVVPEKKEADSEKDPNQHKK